MDRRHTIVCFLRRDRLDLATLSPSMQPRGIVGSLSHYAQRQLHVSNISPRLLRNTWWKTTSGQCAEAETETSERTSL